MAITTLDNVGKVLKERNPVILRRISFRPNKWHKYQLMAGLNFELSNGDKINIPGGFKCDLSSVPAILWPILPPNGDFEIAWLIHDYLYATREKNGYSRAFADKEMLTWSRAINTHGQLIHWRKIDNWLRYLGVRDFGWAVWNKSNV